MSDSPDFADEDLHVSMSTIKCLATLIAILSSSVLMSSIYPWQRSTGVGTYPLTPVHASAWFAERADADGKHLILMVYFEGTPGWQDNVTNFSSTINRSPASIDMLLGNIPVSLKYWSDTRVAKVLDQEFKIINNNVFLVSGIDRVNPTVRGLGLHDLTFDNDDNPPVELVKRNAKIRSLLVGEDLDQPGNTEDGPDDLVVLHRQGLALIRRNDAKSDTLACEIFRQAAQRGYKQSQYSLGYCYESGRGLGQNFVTANTWYLKAAQQGHVDAQYKLAHSYRVGRGVEIDLHAALGWYKKAAENGDGDAQHNVGWMYATGQGVDVNAKLAFHWFLKAAETGDPASQFEIARRYESGDGVGKDTESAYLWLLILKGQKRSLAADDWKHVETVLNSVEKEISTERRVLAEAKSHEWLQAYSKRYLKRLKA